VVCIVVGNAVVVAAVATAEAVVVAESAFAGFVATAGVGDDWAEVSDPFVGLEVPCGVVASEELEDDAVEV